MKLNFQFKGIAVFLVLFISGVSGCQSTTPEIWPETATNTLAGPTETPQESAMPSGTATIAQSTNTPTATQTDSPRPTSTPYTNTYAGYQILKY